MNKNLKLNKILTKALNKTELHPREIKMILNLKNKSQIEKVFTTARKIRKRYFDNKLFLYGFVYFSTYCRNDCTFCYYSNSNTKSPRYRKTIEETIQISKSLADSGVHLIDLTMGEDPLLYNENNFNKLIDLIENVKKEVKLPIMISPGVLPNNILIKSRNYGADWYACYQETHNKKIFSQLRINQNYNKRLEAKIIAKEKGMLIEDGILLGVGEQVEDRVKSIFTMKKLDVDQGRVMSFVPQKGTPMEKTKTPSRNKELLVIAALRLVLQDKLIPASLDVDGIKGLKDRLRAGANVVTSIIPPRSGLAGVSNSTLDIDEGYRTVKGVKEILKDLDLRIATKKEYYYWVKKQKDILSKVMK